MPDIAECEEAEYGTTTTAFFIAMFCLLFCAMSAVAVFVVEGFFHSPEGMGEVAFYLVLFVVIFAVFLSTAALFMGVKQQYSKARQRDRQLSEG